MSRPPKERRYPVNMNTILSLYVRLLSVRKVEKAANEARSVQSYLNAWRAWCSAGVWQDELAPALWLRKGRERSCGWAGGVAGLVEGSDDARRLLGFMALEHG